MYTGPDNLAGTATPCYKLWIQLLLMTLRTACSHQIQKILLHLSYTLERCGQCLSKFHNAVELSEFLLDQSCLDSLITGLLKTPSSYLRCCCTILQCTSCQTRIRLCAFHFAVIVNCSSNYNLRAHQHGLVYHQFSSFGRLCKDLICCNRLPSKGSTHMFDCNPN